LVTLDHAAISVAGISRINLLILVYGGIIDEKVFVITSDIHSVVIGLYFFSS
jgi:hypothetical protein